MCCPIYTNNCGQRVVLPNGDILLALSYGVKGQARSVSGVVCSFDGETLAVTSIGDEIQLSHGRGLLEPSLAEFQGRFFLTLRAEDGRGVKDPDRVALMGNFHITHASPDESWVTVGEWQPRNGIRGDLLLARIRWSQPHNLS